MFAAIFQMLISRPGSSIIFLLDVFTPIPITALYYIIAYPLTIQVYKKKIYIFYNMNFFLACILSILIGK